MSFSCSGRPPTHRPVELDRLLRLASALEDAAPDGRVTPERLEAVAEDEGAPRTHLLAAAALVPGLSVPRLHPCALVHCVGACQQWGALDRLEQSLRARDARLARGAEGFDV